LDSAGELPGHACVRSAAGGIFRPALTVILKRCRFREHRLVILESAGNYLPTNFADANTLTFSKTRKILGPEFVAVKFSEYAN